MISLIQLLKEVVNPPKALILAGAPGAGKGTILGELDLSGLKTFNIDDEIVKLSKTFEGGFTLNQKDTDQVNRSKFMKAMNAATSNLKNKLLPQTLEKKESFILDGTASSSKNTLELKETLEDLGYKVMMLYVYTDLETSLKRNEKRFEKSKGEDRSLVPSSILGVWKSVIKNFELYQKKFSPNFVSVSNLGEEDTLKDIEKIIEKYVDPWAPIDGVEKDEKAKIRSKKQKLKTKQDIQSILNSNLIQNIVDSSVSVEEAQTKITQFLR